MAKKFSLICDGCGHQCFEEEKPMTVRPFRFETGEREYCPAGGASEAKTLDVDLCVNCVQKLLVTKLKPETHQAITEDIKEVIDDWKSRKR